MENQPGPTEQMNEYEYFMNRLEAKKDGVKATLNNLVDDLWNRLAVEFQGGRAFGVESYPLVTSTKMNANKPIKECIEEVSKKVHYLLVDASEEVFSDYEQCLDVGDMEVVVELMNTAAEPKEVFETTEVKKRKRKVPNSSQASLSRLLCMNRKPPNKPFYCRWPGCDLVSKNYYNISKHVRYRHYNLPITHQEQEELNIVDNRDAFKFVGRLTEENPFKEPLMPTEEELYQPEYVKPVKYVCKLESCGRTFKYKGSLIGHERTHLGVKPFKCKWPLTADTRCPFSSIKRDTVRRHIRQKHFKLPKTYKKQVALNIVDSRDPDEFIEEDEEKLSLL